MLLPTVQRHHGQGRLRVVSAGRCGLFGQHFFCWAGALWGPGSGQCTNSWAGPGRCLTTRLSLSALSLQQTRLYKKGKGEQTSIVGGTIEISQQKIVRRVGALILHVKQSVNNVQKTKNKHTFKWHAHHDMLLEWHDCSSTYDSIVHVYIRQSTSTTEKWKWKQQPKRFWIRPIIHKNMVSKPRKPILEIWVWRQKILRLWFLKCVLLPIFLLPFLPKSSQFCKHERLGHFLKTKENFKNR